MSRNARTSFRKVGGWVKAHGERFWEMFPLFHGELRVLLGLYYLKASFPTYPSQGWAFRYTAAVKPL